MTEEECLEVTKIYSISGLLPNGHALMKYRPFRAPHHNASLNALIGGGAYAMPGEVSDKGYINGMEESLNKTDSVIKLHPFLDEQYKAGYYYLNCCFMTIKGLDTELP